MKIKKGDKVQVITGKDKGKQGSVVKAFPQIDKVILDGVNVHKKHIRAKKQGQKGQLVDQAFPIHVSNVKKI
ncbi:MAG TPA: 50S ribosomal protein L24 [Candidatus Paceibacterota bacterium]